MKDVLSNANFPQDAQGRTYHVATKAGQVANRILTVGDFVRAWRIAKDFDGGKPIFEFSSQRNFLTLTGTYEGVPITIVAIECRAVVDGDMIIVRLGSCGSLEPAYGLGTVVVSYTSFGITRNYDYFHPTTTAEEKANGSIVPYHITKPLDCDKEVHDSILAALEKNKPQPNPSLFNGEPVKAAGMAQNASADSFYGSQGRQDPTFFDDNANLIESIKKERPDLATLEMETFVIEHLAHSANVAAEAVGNKAKVRTGALHMIFANRNTSAFITPDECEMLEEWAGKSVLEALKNIEISNDRLHAEGVWGKSV